MDPHLVAQESVGPGSWMVNDSGSNEFRPLSEGQNLVWWIRGDYVRLCAFVVGVCVAKSRANPYLLKLSPPVVFSIDAPP